MHSLKQCLNNAVDRRAALLERPETTVLRLVHGEADGVPGLVLDRFGEMLIAQCFEGRLDIGEAVLRTAVDELRQRLGAKAVYRKRFVRDRAQADDDVDAAHHDATPWLGSAVEAEVPVLENGLTFLIRPYDGFSVGLFLEHRDNRQRIRELATGKRVLNGFGYTCAFSVAAAAGGAASVSSVDVSKRYLEWGKRNFAANGLPLDDHRFFCSDMFDFYQRAQRQGRRFDLIVLDPPTFARLRRPARTFSIETDLAALCSQAVELLDPGGILFLASNCQRLSREDLISAVRHAGTRRCTILDTPLPPFDFHGDETFSKTVIARLD